MFGANFGLCCFSPDLSVSRLTTALLFTQTSIRTQTYTHTPPLHAHTRTLSDDFTPLRARRGQAACSCTVLYSTLSALSHRQRQATVTVPALSS